MQYFLYSFDQGTFFEMYLDVLVFYTTHFEIYHLERFRRPGVKSRAKHYIMTSNLVPSTTEKKISLMDPKGRIKIRSTEDNFQDG